MIELLVVIAIIALMVSLLFPVLGKSFERAARTQCMANLRSLYQAGMSWSAEHKGRILPAEVRGHPTLGSGKWTDYVRPYAGDRNLTCPRTPKDWHWGYGMSELVRLNHGRTAKNLDYWHASGSRVGWSGPIYVETIDTPSRQLFLVDFSEWQFNDALVYRSPSFFPSERHGREERLNAVFYDGGMHLVKLEEAVVAGGYKPR